MIEVMKCLEKVVSKVFAMCLTYDRTTAVNWHCKKAKRFDVIAFDTTLNVIGLNTLLV